MFSISMEGTRTVVRNFLHSARLRRAFRKPHGCLFTYFYFSHAFPRRLLFNVGRVIGCSLRMQLSEPITVQLYPLRVVAVVCKPCTLPTPFIFLPPAR